MKNYFKRTLALLLVLALIPAFLISCGGKTLGVVSDKRGEDQGTSVTGAGSDAGDHTATTAPDTGAPKDGVIGERPHTSGSDHYSGEMPPVSADDKSTFDGIIREGGAVFDGEIMPSAPGDLPGDVVGPIPGPGDPAPGYPQPSAGLLTAGEWKDLDNIAFFTGLFQREDWTRIAKSRALTPYNIVKVSVLDSDLPCFNVPVTLGDPQNAVYTAVTDVQGNAYLVYDGALPESVSVNGKDFALEGKKEITLDIKDAGMKVTELDLMLMIDTTGSMGDELEYIKAELADMVTRISKADEALSIRVSVNFYRDEGDDYVVKYYDFRSDINECLEQIKKEYAMGGGDTPEAVHTALENAVTGHDWRENAVKLCFFVLDAPPHSESEIQGINSSIIKSLKAAAEKGIRIIPVASSGVDTETEIILRSFAVMTGGTYIFLTNHSGIGGDHLEPTIGEYTVEALNNCMVRVACEYCGITPPPVIENNAQ